MASISIEKKTKLVRIIFKDAQGDRKAIRLGKVPKKLAQEIKVHVESIVSAQILGVSMTRADAHWLKELSPIIRQKISIVGLCPKKQGSTKLGEFLKQYIADRPNTKPNTVKGWKSGARNLKAFFGADKDIRTITVAAAGAFERYLETSARNDRGKKGTGESPLALNRLARSWEE